MDALDDHGADLLLHRTTLRGPRRRDATQVHPARPRAGPGSSARRAPCPISSSARTPCSVQRPHHARRRLFPRLLQRPEGHCPQDLTPLRFTLSLRRPTPAIQEISMLEAYRHTWPNAPPSASPRCRWTAQQTAAVIELVKAPPAGEDAFLLDLLTYRVPRAWMTPPRSGELPVGRRAWRRRGRADLEGPRHRAARHDGGRLQRQAADRPARFGRRRPGSLQRAGRRRC